MNAGGALTESAPLFAALGDPTRLELVSRLSERGPQSIARLTAGLHCSRQAVTKHLRVLAGAGLARSLRSGRETRWEIEASQLEVARRYLDMISQRWDERLAALEQHLETPKPVDPRT